jgi:tetratricopeptide (TPR) repeat protein
MTAIGTLFLYLKDYEKARKYLEDAIKLNERYEKAFYRLAQTYEEEKNIVKVFETLKEFEKSKRPFHLDKFKKMYEKYKDCLTLEPEPGKKLMLWYPLGEPSGPPVIGRNLGSKQNYRLT